MISFLLIALYAILKGITDTLKVPQMKTIISFLLFCLSFSVSSQIYIDPSAKVNGVGTIESPYKYITSFRTKTIHYIKAGTTFSYNKEIKNDSVVIRLYGEGIRPLTKSKMVFSGKYISINNIVFKDTSKTDLVTIKGGGMVFIANCDFIAKSKALVLDSLKDATLFGNIIKAEGIGVCARKIENLTIYKLTQYGSDIENSFEFNQIGVFSCWGVNQDQSDDRAKIKEVIKILSE